MAIVDLSEDKSRFISDLGEFPSGLTRVSVFQPTSHLRILKSPGYEKIQQLYVDHLSGEQQWCELPIVEE